MSTRRLRLTIVASLCGLACALAVGAMGTVAGAAQFGGKGTGAGQFLFPFGVGIDQATQDVYTGESLGRRVDKFDASGNFLLAWGWNVNGASPAEELQTCTTLCERGSPGSGAGQFGEGSASGVAVDNDPLSASYGDVYVVDRESFRVEKFDSSGNFILMFGAGVNEATHGDVCVAGEKCTKGAPGTADGQFEWAFRSSYIAVGPGGAVYVGDMARVQVFEPSGVWRENVSLAELSSTGQVTALAVDPAGDMYVKDSEVPGVREFEPSGLEASTQFDVGSESVDGLALDEKGDLYVGDTNGGFHVLEYDAAGSELASFGSKTAEFAGGMAFSNELGELYVAGYVGSEYAVWVLAPPQGPLIEPESESATPGRRGKATLQASIDPEGAASTYHFEYVAEKLFQESGYANASSTPSTAIGAGFADQSASAELTALVPGGTYHYRVVATNSKGTATGVDETVTTVPPALVEGPWVTDVASTSATFDASIDPLGVSTEYRLEYGTSTAYGQTLSGSVGAGEGYVPVSYHRDDLLPGTTYHYRLVTTNEVGTIEGVDRTLTTQPTGGQELTLPDGRAWELVSPPNKGGALIEGYEEVPIQAANDGSGIAYGASEAIGEDPVGKTFFSQILSTRVPGGWRSQDISPPHHIAREEEITDEGFEYRVFSPDLSLAAIQQRGSAVTPLSPEVTEGKLYLRDDSNGSFLALLTPKNVLPGTKLDGEAGEADASREFKVELRGASTDLSHVLMTSDLRLTSEAPVGGTGSNLYEWSAGQLQLVSILPNEEPVQGEVELAQGQRAVSSDGRWVLWTLGEVGEGEDHSTLYVRDMVAKKTMQIGGVDKPRPETMSSDGSRIFFLEGGELYEFDALTGVQTDLTAGHGAGERDGGVKDEVLGASEDGSYVYFVATGVLASGAVSGEDNVYVAHEEGGGWTTRYVTTLSSADEDDWFNAAGSGFVNLAGVRSRVSPNGRYLELMSSRSLTGYDNIDANSGQPDDEVYLYDALANRLVCTSCNPSGARPVGVLDTDGNILMDRNVSTEVSLKGHWLAGIVPGWDELSNELSLYQPRYLANSGRLFFDSPDALVPQDTNGLMDVYEYEPTSSGSCTAADTTFSTRSGGCVNLISSGTSSSESAFLDASETGDDVFFLTASRLSAADYDTSLDVYDAHVCSTAVPCVSVPVAPPPCTSGDSCKAAPAPQPEVFGAPPSATFSGAGNVVEEVKQSGVGGKSKPKVKRKRRSKRQAKRRRHRVKRASGLHAGRASRKGKR